MSLQVLWTLFNAHPAKLVNILALLFACPGGWLLHATRCRELRAQANLAGQGESAVALLDAPTVRMNRFFYRFGFACLGMALLVSWISTRL
ncbi:hypothetical protein [Pseudomonas sp. R5(2019)]|uniref:hypothetical protein n=1 Tax=Pseudomonas sp. R5(2019) TaxID=2697566 RepID=UPI001411C58B|nr:hypothetical protein [Pseudomonas sp. R5(2019)]NBA94963.1 hypothetical protein [Pseudomonas sp. R5(2019)]